jgi:hypothetical protein
MRAKYYLGAAAHAELLQDILDMGFHRWAGNREGARYLGIRHSLRDQAEDHLLSWRQFLYYFFCSFRLSAADMAGLRQECIQFLCLDKQVAERNETGYNPELVRLDLLARDHAASEPQQRGGLLACARGKQQYWHLPAVIGHDEPAERVYRSRGDRIHTDDKYVWRGKLLELAHVFWRYAQNPDVRVIFIGDGFADSAESERIVAEDYHSEQRRPPVMIICQG